MRKLFEVGMVALVATQLIGCGWYLKPRKGNGQFVAGPSAGQTWGGGSDLVGSADGVGDGAGDGFGAGMDDNTWGAGDSEKTRLSGQPKYMLDTVYFDYDRANLRPDQLVVLERNLAWIRQNPGSQVRLEGHCDERGTEEYNLALGDNRADSVREWLVAHGVSGSHTDTVSKGELEPAVLGAGEGSWAKNRRVEFLVLE